MKDPAQLWADPRLIYSVAVAAVTLLLATFWLFRRKKRSGRQAGVICLILSVILHAALIFLVPYLSKPNGGSATADAAADLDDIGVDSLTFSTFDPDMVATDAAGSDWQAAITPLPVADLTDLLQTPEPTTTAEPVESTLSDQHEPAAETLTDETRDEPVPKSLANSGEQVVTDAMSEIDRALGDWLDATADVQPSPKQTPPETQPQFAGDTGYVGDEPPAPSTPTPAPTKATVAATSQAPPATIPGSLKSDFANRVGQAKTLALTQTGGNAQTEAAVAAALRFLAQSQRGDGAWDPKSTFAGQERSPLGESRGGAGSRAESAITGLALLTLIGAGNTHQSGDYADNVYRGLAYLINQQQPSGSLAGNASAYASTYSHGMAALAMCEAAAITGDPSATTAARRAVNFTSRQQHSTTGGWRYLPGDPGDLSQLGWQAMVLDAGHRAEIQVDRRSVAGVTRFLRSVRTGTNGGLASYRAGEAPSRTMTAEALATRLLIGQSVPPVEIAEAQRYLMQQPPGVGQDNYYYWYYATLALHQLQDDTWQQWNAALQQRLLSTQKSDGSWPTNSVWGGYGGSVYTTSMAALCLESYYRHALRSDRTRIAELK